jgi:hypothetical protein
MAFTDQEKQLIIWGKQNGKSADDIENAIAKLRAGVVPQSSAAPAADEPGFLSRAASDIKDAGEKVGDTLSQSPTSVSGAIKLGTQATAQAFGGVASVIADAIRSVPGGKAALDAIGGVASAGFKALTDKLANTKFFQEAAAGLPENGTLENVLGAASAGSEIASDILGADVGVGGAAKVGTAAKNATEAAATTVKDAATAASKTANRVMENGKHVVSDLVPSRQGFINEQVSKALDLTPGDLSTIAKSTGNDVGTWLSDKNLIGKNKAQTQKLVDDYFSSNYKIVRDEIGKVDRVYKPNQVPRFTDALKQIQAKVTGVPGLEQTAADVDNLLHKSSLSLNDVQAVKELLDEHFSLYTKGGDVAENVTKQGLDNIRTELKQFIETQVKDETGADIGGLNNNVATAKTISNAITARAPRGLKRSNLRPGDFGTFWFGSTFASPLVGAALVFAKKVIESPSVRLRMARYLDEVSDAQKARMKSELEKGSVPGELNKLLTDGN